MLSWRDWKTKQYLGNLSEADLGILTQAQQEIERHFADFQQQMTQAIGQPKDSWMSWGAKKLGSAVAGNPEKPVVGNARGQQRGAARGAIGGFLSRMGEKLRPRTSMERDYKTAQATAESVVHQLLKDVDVPLNEGTIPDMIGQLKQKVMATLNRVVQQVWSATGNVEEPEIGKQPTGKSGQLAALVSKYGGMQNVPPEEIAALYPLLKSGDRSAASKKAIQATPPVGKLVRGPDDLRPGDFGGK
jgi:hypothetical protein